MLDEQISGFVEITGASATVARRFVEITGGDIEQAVMLYFENPDLQHSVDSVPSRPAETTTSGNRRGVREDESGVIHIDSDDDMTVDDDDEDVEVIAAVARNAQEEEDAAMAQRLQQEMYAEGGGIAGGIAGAQDGVRSPIRSTHETLVAPLPGWAAGSDHDDIEPEILEQLQRRRQPRSRSPREGMHGDGGANGNYAAGRPNPFNQNMWDSPDGSIAPAGPPGSRTQRLTDLFRPPYDLISRLGWDEARDEGKETKKWILVNIQDMSDFHCQALNRDVWKDEAVAALVRENFIFLQYTKDDHLARDYLNFYFKNHEDISNYPHVAIVDPRTGEQVKVWSGQPFPSALEFHGQLAEFLDRYSLAANSKNPVVRAKSKPPQVVDVDRMTEDQMLEMALKQSLEASNGGGESSRQSNIVDPDSLTKSPSPKSKQLPTQSLSDALNAATPSASQQEQQEPAATTEESAFAQISSSNPHEEPKNDPATTTRIQFRHATGRIIRRFRTQDRVERIYEWLKAEPMEGKDGVEFELKKMPEGQDLLESLDLTVEEAGLKQGTVMIEFIE